MKKNIFGLTIAASLVLTLMVYGFFASTTHEVSPLRNSIASSTPYAITEKIIPLSKDQFFKRYAEITGRRIEQIKVELKDAQTNKVSSYANDFDQEYSVIYDLGGGVKVKSGVLAQITQVSFGGSTGYKINKIYRNSQYLIPFTAGTFVLKSNYIFADVIDAHRLQLSYNGYAETPVTHSYSIGLQPSAAKLVTLDWNFSGTMGTTNYFRKPFNSGKTWTIS